MYCVWPTQPRVLTSPLQKKKKTKNKKQKKTLHADLFFPS